MSSGKGEDWLDELRDLVPTDPPEPWGDAAPDRTTLTDEQRRFLDALADNPPVARLRDLEPHVDDDGVDGGLPGDSPGS